MSRRLRMGLVGPGFIAPHHIDAVRRLGNVDVLGIAGSSPESAARKAHELGVERSYASYTDLIADQEIDVVHNTTPNHLHLPVSLAALRAGKHVVSDKPLARTAAEAHELAAAAAQAGVVNAVTFNYRGNPLVQEARAGVASHALGDVVFVHGVYLQDWMTSDRVYSWRSDPEKGGASSALADIGSHWCDLAEHITGARITQVLADTTTVVRTRYASGGSKEAFSVATSSDETPVEVAGEDLATVLLRFSNGARGTFSVGQVLPGHKNDLRIEVNGRKASLAWQQERQNEMWIGHFDAPNESLLKDPSLMSAAARKYAHLPGGHGESWADAFRNVIADIYTWISTGKRPATVCTFADAAHGMDVLEAALRSSARGGAWEQVDSVPSTAHGASR